LTGSPTLSGPAHGRPLAAGCTVVLKLAHETTLDAYFLAEAALEAELPAGVLNIVPGGRQTGADLVLHRDVDKVAFTGSTKCRTRNRSGGGRLLRPVTLELGGKSAAILTDGADLLHFLQQLPAVCLPNNGQTCHASTCVLGFIEAGRRTAARITTGRSVPADQAHGFWVAPTVFADVDNSSMIAREGPLGRSCASRPMITSMTRWRWPTSPTTG
jgi:aldehyde dehydrogenase (NAD+)